MQRADRYTRTAMLLHWLIAALVLLQISWGWYMQDIAKQPPGPRVDAFNLHKSVGLSLLLLMCARLFWRWSHSPPPLPPLPHWQTRLVRANHWVLYAALFVMPIAGYLGSAYSGYPVKYFGMSLPAWAGKDVAIKEFMSTLHWAASWVLLTAIALHIGGALKHWLIDRDGIASRMGLGARPADPA